ncbi:MAG TPA: hypothetical protein GXX38_10190 [Clostridia bacterium]|jgi:hypothetical protein|nr:hypothetical protein [Clostridia bacterium]
MKILINILFVVTAFLLALFGLGPVLLADGSFLERMFFLALVIICYLLWGILLRLWIKRSSSKKK